MNTDLQWLIFLSVVLGGCLILYLFKVIYEKLYFYDKPREKKYYNMLNNPRKYSPDDVVNQIIKDVKEEEIKKKVTTRREKLNKLFKST